MAKGYTEFEGLDPRTRGMGVFRLSRELFARFSRYVPEPKVADVYCVRIVTRTPAVAYRGLRTIDEKMQKEFGDRGVYVETPNPHGLCLAALPKQRRTREGRFFDPPSGYTFAVFVDAELSIMDWDWIYAGPDGVSPIGSSVRFDEKVYP